MSKSKNQATKAEVNSTKLNKLPVPGEDDTEFSAEEAAHVFEKQPSSQNNNLEQDPNL
ncbi:hypothetical protein ACFQ3J_14120 [Paenibacillus provencensis]|uniref:YfhD-like protein n=1 Tax=Paenibacillus provencensis TaxID=441151 RepID=A0ABW3PXK7_9BACL|nr:hypothetical protein [Paenibacillus sp. MER 78]MCM3127771.1 hypothetical protein [Paenibacillus sp. MER 78]